MAVNQEALRGMPLANLRELNSAIVAEINFRNAQKRQTEMRKFSYGEKAQFRCSRTGRMIQCRITKMNTKTIGVLEIGADGKNTQQQWRVSPNLLIPVVE